MFSVEDNIFLVFWWYSGQTGGHENLSKGGGGSKILLPTLNFSVAKISLGFPDFCHFH